MFSKKLCFYGLWIGLIYVIPNVGGAWLRCYKGALDDYLVATLDKPLPSSFVSCLDPTLPTIVYTFGYRGRSAGPATTAVLSAYIGKKKRNVLLLDWEEEARSGLLGIPLGYAFSAVPNAKKVGRDLGEALLNLHKAGINMTHDVHLIGHSLGAHIMGYAGKQTRESSHIVARITGLDPARALFEGTFTVQYGLDHTCAKFVDIIHSDPGGYGTSESKGTVDIWPNYGTSGTTQPGCPNGDFDMFTTEECYPYECEIDPQPKIKQIINKAFKRRNLCNHDRSWKYYVEAVQSPTAFPAGFAPDYDSWVANAGQTKLTIYIGDLTSARAQGNFYLTTNTEQPFGRGFEGLKPNKFQTRERRNSTLTKLLTYLR